MILSDKDIIKGLQAGVFSISPVCLDDIQPASVDLHLDNILKTIDGISIDLLKEPYELKPKEFILGSTVEFIRLPVDLVGIVNGKSSLGRLGIQVHITAGYVDPNYYGNITLELFNVSDTPFTLKYDMKICQLIFETLSSPCERPYGSKGLGSKYQGSKGVVNSRYDGK